MKKSWVLATSLALCVVQVACGEPSSNKENAGTTTPSTASSPQPAEKPASETVSPQSPDKEKTTAQPMPEAAGQPKKKEGPCAEYRKTLCAGKKGKEVKACLVEHKDQLNDACKKALKI